MPTTKAVVAVAGNEETGSVAAGRGWKTSDGRGLASRLTTATPGGARTGGAGGISDPAVSAPSPASAGSKSRRTSTAASSAFKSRDATTGPSPDAGPVRRKDVHVRIAEDVAVGDNNTVRTPSATTALRYDETAFEVDERVRSRAKVASLAQIARCLRAQEEGKREQRAGRKLNRWEHKAFMDEFWALYYHFPLEASTRVGDGITVPAPSARDRCPSPLEVEQRKKRIASLSKPRRITRKREEVLLQREAEQAQAKQQAMERKKREKYRKEMMMGGIETLASPLLPFAAAGDAKKGKGVEGRGSGARNGVGRKRAASHNPRRSVSAAAGGRLCDDADKDWEQLIVMAAELPFSPPESLRKNRFERHMDIKSAGLRAFRHLRRITVSMPPAVGGAGALDLSFYDCGHQAAAAILGSPTKEVGGVGEADPKETGAVFKMQRCDACVRHRRRVVKADARGGVQPRPSSAFPARRLPSTVKPKGSVDDLDKEHVSASDLDLAKPSFYSFADLMAKAPKILKARFSEVVGILKKPNFQRSDDDINLVHTCLRHLPAFRKINSDFIFTQICNRATIQEYSRGAVVFNQGDPGEAWHIILMGRVNVMVSKGFDFSKKYVIAVLGCGDAFGSQALINDGPRTATVVCETNCCMLRLGKMDYKNLLGFMHMIEQKEIMHFLRHKVPLFQFFETAALRNVTDRLSIRSYAPNSVIIHEGELRDHIFIVKSGLCAVYRKIAPLEKGSKKPRDSQLFLGNLTRGAHFNEGVVTDPHCYAGCPFTVVAVDEVECGTVSAIGEWVNMKLNLQPSQFAAMSQVELVRSKAMESRKRKFRKYQAHVLVQLAKERTRDPGAGMDQPPAAPPRRMPGGSVVGNAAAAAEADIAWPPTSVPVRLPPPPPIPMPRGMGGGVPRGSSTAKSLDGDGARIVAGE
ncbi:hypothetical protein HDU96_007111 [Phlyctochytrium bullatum]|nr:hypothetical protein HDU96_007111 [Phlyctochytrium bullatum]